MYINRTLRHFILTLFIAVIALQSRAQSLVAGDIAIIGVGVDTEEVLLVALNNVPAGESVFFTDDEWNGTAFNSGEGFYEWVTPAIVAGDVFTITSTSCSAGGTVSQRAGSMALGNSGDGFYLYQTSTNVYNTGSVTHIGFAGEDVGDAGTLPAGLTLGTTAIYFGGDNAIYVGPRSGFTSVDYLPEIYGSTWTTSGTAQTFDFTDFTFAAASTATMDYYNLQWPANGTIDVGGSFTAYAQGYEAGVTDIGNNPGTGVECWIGYSTTDASTVADFDGAGWTWVPATFNSQQGNNNEFSVDFGSGISTAGTYYYVSRWSLENGPYTYGGFQNAWDGTSVPSGVLTVNDVTMDYANLQSPQNGSITVGGNFDVYAQGYEPGVTEASGAGTGVQCWIGYSTTDATTSADFTGANWTWVPATFGSQQGNNDEFVAEIGSGLTPGSYYYVSRWQLGSGSYTYGGYNGGAWDGSANVSGTLSVSFPPCTAAFTEDFTGFTESSYATGVLSINGNDWTVNGAGNTGYASSSLGGASAITINDDVVEAYITTPLLNTVGRLSFDYAYINGTATNTFVIQTSTDGVTFTTVDTRTLGAGANQNLTPYSLLLNENGPVYVRIMSDEEDAHIFIDNFEATCYVDPTVQVDLPVTFDDPTVNYALVDFAGNASSLIVDPTDAGNIVVQTLKTAGALTYAGTTIAEAGAGSPDLAFANPIPFTSGDKSMSVRIWSPQAGIPIMLKVEDQTNNTIFAEAQATVSVANAWDTLVFDFGSTTGGVLDLANTYDKASLFYNFGAAGVGTTFYWDDVEFITSPPASVQMDLPVTFDDASVNYGVIAFEGAVSSIIVDPNDASNMLVQSEKPVSAQPWAGSSLATDSAGSQLGFANAIPFTATNQRLSVRVWAPQTGVSIMLKIEDETDNTIFVEAQDVVEVANAWDTLYFDYSNPTGGALNLANTYDKVSIFYDFLNPADGSVFYFDNVEFAPVPLTQMDLPVTFDDATVDYGTIDFGGNVSAFVVDPADASNNVVQSIKTAGSQTWAGTSLATDNGSGQVAFANAIPFSSGNLSMSVRVWAPAVGMPIMMKIEDQTNGAVFVEAQDTTTVAGAWETLVFDFGNPTNQTLNLANTYDKVSMFFNWDVAGANDTFYWDDVEFVPAPVASVQMDLPVTFDDASVNYGTIDFGGTVSSIIVDPNDASNMLVQTEKTAGANFWAGTSLAIDDNGTQVAFANPIPFTANDQRISVRIWAPQSGIPVMVKVENQNDPTIYIEAQDVIDVANAWDTLYFDFGNPTNGVLNLANTYDKVSLFYYFEDPAGVGSGDIFYWDDVEFLATPAASVQMDLPVTFDDVTVNYGTIDFGGNASSFIADPADASNNVVQSIKTAGSQTWAGTSLATDNAGTQVGFANAIPFTATDQRLSVRVWAPAVGMPIMMKLEDQTNGAVFVEAQDTTTVAGAWDTLYFDYSTPTNGSLDLANTYDKVSMFFNWDVAGANDTFYWDDVEFNPAPVLGVSPYCASPAFHFGGDANSEILLTITNLDANTMYVEIESADANDPVDVLIVTNGSGATISAADFSIPGKIRQTLTWSSTPPATVDLNVLWSKQSFAGNWQLTQTDQSYNFADSCAGAAPVPTVALDYYNLQFPGTGNITIGDAFNVYAQGYEPGITEAAGAGTGVQCWIGYSTVDAVNLTEFTGAGWTWIPASYQGQGSGGLDVNNDEFVAEIGSSLAAGTYYYVSRWQLDGGPYTYGGFNSGEWDGSTNVSGVLSIVDPSAPTVQMDLPVTFDDTTVIYGTVDFGGTASSFIIDPTSVQTYSFNVTASSAIDYTISGTDRNGAVAGDDPAISVATGDSVIFEINSGPTHPFVISSVGTLPSSPIAGVANNGATSGFVTWVPTTAGTYYYICDNHSSMVGTITVTNNNNVVQTIKTAGANFWAGTSLAAGNPSVAFANPIPFTSGDQSMSVRIWSPQAGIPVLLKAEDQTDANIFVETTATISVANAWDTLIFDFSSAGVDLNQTYDKVSLFYYFEDPAGVGVGDTFYWDDVEFITSPPASVQMDLPVTFDDASVNYGTIDFGGTVSSIIVDPNDASNNVVQTEKTAGAQTWAGTTLATDSAGSQLGFASAVPFTAIDQRLSVRIWSPQSGVTVMLKLEDETNPAIIVEAQDVIDVANAWDTLYFDYSSPSAGVLDLANTYDKASLFYDFNNGGTGTVFYWDNVEFAPLPLAQMDLPVTFDDPTVDYGTIDFGGNVSAFVADPADASNNVVQSIKTAGSQTWAGTSLATDNAGAQVGFANAIPFTATDQRLSVRVWAPAVGMPIMLKLEDQTNAGINVEAQDTTRVAGAWDTLFFDYSTPTNGSLNLANTYDKASMFFNFNVAGANDTFYWDDVEFNPAPVTPVVVGESPYCGTSVTHFAGDPNSEILLTIANLDATSMYVEIESANGSDPVDVLVVNNGSGAAISAEDFSVAGKIRRTLTWSSGAPTTVDLNLLWSTQSFGGNWQLSQSDITINFVDTCPPAVAPPAPCSTFAEDFTGYTGNTYSTGVVTINGNDWTLNAAGNPSYAAQILGTGVSAITINDDQVEASITTPLLSSVGTISFDYAFWNGTETNTFALQTSTDGVTFTTVDAHTLGASALGTLVSYSFTVNDTASMYIRIMSDEEDAHVFIDNFEVTCYSLPTVQMDLPVTFDDPTVNYGTVDFGGNASSFIVDPTDASNNVVQTIKTAGANFWAGTSLAAGNPSVAFANPIPFTSGDQSMSVRIWSPQAGIPVLLKAEDQTDANIFVETTATISVANAWDTLIFDFSSAGVDLNQTYDKVSLFYYFEDPAGVGVGDTFYWDDVEFITSPPASVQMDLPVTFDDASVNYGTIDFGGTVSSIIVDPNDASNNVVQTEKTAGAQTWAGTTLATDSAGSQLGFASAVPFTAIDQRLSVRIWSPQSGVTVMLKLEDETNPAIIVEAQDVIDVANAWDTLYFDYSSPSAGVLDLANTYDKASLFYDFNNSGTGTVFYWDNVEFAPLPLAQMDLPVTFDDPTVDYGTIDFGGNASAFVADPADASNNVVQSIKTAGSQVWAGTSLATTSGGSELGFANAIPFSSGDQSMSVRVWSPTAGITMMLKAEDQTNGAVFVEAQATVSAANTWETLVFDFGNATGGSLNLANTYDKVALFYNFGTAGANDTFYWDDVEFITSPPASVQMDLPVTFDDASVNYGTIDFGGTVSSIIVDPNDASNNVVQTEKTAGAQTWAGTTLATDSAGSQLGFASAVPFTAIDQRLSVRIWSPQSGVTVMLKLEDETNPAIIVEAQDVIDVANAWDTLYFDYSSPSAGVLDLANTYDKASLFYDFNNGGTGTVFYWDNVEFAPLPLAQMDLPVTFDDPTVDYGTIDFGGNVSAFVVDPADASNNVVQSIKTAGSQTWAGTSLATDNAGAQVGFANAIPFTATDQRLSVRVWAPAVGMPIMLKLEDQTNAGINVEAQDTTRVAGAWDTLFFDYSTPTNGSLNLANTYDKASMFFNFNVAGANDTFYWDDVEFNPAPDLCVNFVASAVVDSNVSTVGGSDGGATASATGGLAPYTYLWSNSATTPSITGVVAGTYSVTVTDANSCQSSSSVTIIESGPAPCSTFAEDFTGYTGNTYSTGVVTINGNDWTLNAAGNPSYAAQILGTGVSAITINDDQVEASITTPLLSSVGTISFDYAFWNGTETNTFALQTSTDGVTFTTVDAHTLGASALGTLVSYSFTVNDTASMYIRIMSDEEDAHVFIDNFEVTCYSLPTVQMDLPVTFDDPTVNYGTVDFGGNASSFIVDPTDASNNVVQTIKTAGANFWAGTSLAAGNPSVAFANPIPFTSGDQSMSVRIWSPQAGIPVLLKAEDQTDANIFVETTATISVANAWDTLIFDFSSAGVDLNQTYDKVSLFYYFEDPAGVGVGDTFYWDDVEFITSPPASVQMDLPVTFDDASVNYGTIDFGGTVSSIIVDPNDATNNVVQTEKTAGAQTWAGTTLATDSAGSQLGFANAVPFTAIDQRLSVRIWSPQSGVTVMLKLEDETNPAIIVEAQDVIDVANAWDTLYFDYSSPSAGVLDLANTYDKASLFYDFNNSGTGTVFYWDNVEFAPLPLAQMDLPVTFDDPTVDYGTIDFGGNASAFVADPVDASNNVVQSIKTAGSQVWAGTSLATTSGGSELGFANAIPFSSGDQSMSVRVWSPTAGITMMLKAEDQTNGAVFVEAQATVSAANTWETLVFDFGNATGGSLNLANTYDKVALFYNFGTAGANDTFYWDDVEFITSPPASVQMDLPVTFDDASVNYGTIDFGGTVSSIIVDPNDASNNVVQTEKTAGAQTWAGTTLATDSAGSQLGFASAVPFTAIDQRLSVRIWSPQSGVTVMLKLEDETNPAIIVEAQDVIDVANAWDTLYFDYSSPSAGVLDLANTYDKASLFYDFNNSGTGTVFYWDNVEFAPLPLAQMDLPVTFDDPTVDYGTIDFGGNVSAFVADPADASNNVVQSIKTAGSQTWAGTSLATDNAGAQVGFANAIPFTATDQRLSVRVWAPAVGMPIMLKLEDQTNAGINVEAQDTTRVAGAWDTLFFDYSTPTNGSLNLANTYDKASMFFNFNVAGANDTFYWDDVEFNPAPIAPITVELSIDNGNIVEGQTATVTATASGAVSSDETVTLTVTGVDATDYTLGSITILSGQSTGTATFTAVDDSDDEITEEAVIAISALSAGLDSGSVVSVREYITDNDYASLTVPVSQSFETAATGSQYVDSMGLGSIDHDLYSFPGAQAIDYVSSGDIGFDASYEHTGSVGLTDGDFVGVTDFAGTVGSYADGSQGYQLSDVDGVMAVEFDPVSLTGFASYAFDMDYFVQSTGYESSDSLHIYLVTDAGTLDLLRVNGTDIEGGAVTEGQWIGINQDLTGYTSAQLFVRFISNSGAEAVYIDDINFTGSSSPTVTASVDTLNFGGLVEGSTESSVETFTVTASNLTGDITVTGVSGLEISLDGVSYSAGPLTISPVSGSVSGATVYARIPNTVTAASGEPTGNVVLTAAGATQVDVAVVATVTAPAADCSELFFSEYIEGSGLNKCLEIYNPTSSAVSLAGYTIGMFDNGATNMNASRSFTFPAGTGQSVGALDVWVGCDSSAGADFLAESDTTFGFPSPLSFNGDDAIVLMTPSGITVDVIGRIGEDPGSYWGSTVQTRNQTLVRSGSIVRGDNDANDAFDPATEWESFPQNTYQTLGWHNSDCDANNVAVWSGGAGSSDWSNNANWTSGIAPTAASTRIVVPSNPSGGQVFPTYTGGTLTLGNTVVGSGASLNIGAGAVCQIGANATLASAGSIVLESDGSGTAMFDDFSQAGAIFYGEITMQQFVGGIIAAQHYISSPVSNVPLTEWADDPQELSGYGSGLTGVDGVAVTPASNCSPDSISPSSNYGNLFQWDPETVINTFCPEQAGWVVRSAGNMEDGRGYSAYLAGGNSTLSVTGTPNTGDVIYTMDAVGILQNIPLSNWDILGNPYPSSLDRNNLIIGNSGLNSPSYWDPSGTYSGTYQPYTPGSVIPSMQGFAANWNAGGSTADITYTNAMRSTTAGTWRSATIDGDINIELRGNGYGDVTRIFFGEMMTSTFDALEDAYKFESAAGQPTLFTGDDANMLSMNGRSNPVMGDQIALGVMPGQSGSFTLDFTSVEGLPYGSLLFLEDKSEGTWTQVAEGDVYAFTMTELDDYNRFVLHITPAVVVSAEDGDCSVSNGVLHVEAPSFMVEGQEVAWNYVISDAQGVVSTGVLSGAIEMPVHTTGNLTVNLANAYTSLTDVVYVETSLLPVVSLSDVSDEVGNSVSFVSPMIGEWMIDGVVISEGIDFVWTSLAAGTYELVFVGYTELGCEVRTSCTIEMTDKVSSTTDVLLGQSQVLVTEDYVRIESHGSHTIANLYNMEGKVVASTLIAQGAAMLSTDGLATGVYTLSLEGNAQVESLQLFID